MVKKDLVSKVANSNGCTKTLAASIIDDFCMSIAEAVSNGDCVHIRGFGTFQMKERAERVGRNPHTGEKIKISKGFSPVFIPGKFFYKDSDDSR